MNLDISYMSVDISNVGVSCGVEYITFLWEADALAALSYVYSKQLIFGLTQEWLREVWSPRQGICLFTPVWDPLLPLA